MPSRLNAADIALRRDRGPYGFGLIFTLALCGFVYLLRIFWVGFPRVGYGEVCVTLYRAS